MTDKKDLYKDTPIRLLGYANEVGEALRIFIGPKWVQFSYVIASVYVVADTTDKTITTYQKTKEKILPKTTFVMLDTLLWQMFASIIIPGYTINRLCIYTGWTINRYNFMRKKKSKSLIISLIGLISIPIIIKPIDYFVDQLMDKTIRKFKID